MKTYVLVHGAWHGAWCWSRLVPLLAADGHRVYAPSLTGLGDRAHLFSAQVDLAMHVRDVLELVEAEELHDFVLVGHSYGGNVITGVADALGDRIAHCFFLDAVVPPEGRTDWRWCDIAPAAIHQQRLAQIREEGCGIALPPPPPSSFGVDDADDLEWLARRLRPMPAGTYTGPIRLRRGGSDGLARTYVAAVRPVYEPLRAVHDRIRSAAGWRYLEIDTGHDMMLTAPSALHSILLAC